MSATAAVLQAYGDAWARRRFFVITQVTLRLAALAVIAPALAGLVNLAVSLSSQSALTDQDIALFFLSPVGFLATIAVLSILLVAEVGGFAVMAAVYLAGPADRWLAARQVLAAVLVRVRPLLVFAGLFVLRVLAIVLPFALAGLLVARRFLGTYDINYYLTARPPEFLIAAVLIAVIVVAMAGILLATLSGWALSMHLVVFSGVRPSAAFAESAARMRGRRTRLQLELIVWLLIRLVLATLLGVIAGAVLNLVPLSPDANLRTALTLTLIVVAVWSLAGLVLSAVALGALARMLDRFFEGDRDLPPVPETAPATMKRRLAVAAVAGLVLTGAGYWAGAELLDRLDTVDEVEIIAHRGAAGVRPENTMAAFEQAIADRADWIELDVQETRDGEVVVLHDSDFMKLAGGDLRIWEADLADLADIDVGGWFDPAYSDQRVPLLRDVLTMAKGRVKVLIELKYYGHDEDLEARVAGIVDDLDMAGDVAVMSLKYPAVLKMQDLRPGWRSGVLAATAVGDLAGLKGDFLAVSGGMAGVGLASSVQATGKDLYVWTINDPLQMSKMMSAGVNGLITDEPALARKVIELRAGLSAGERLVLLLSEVLGVELTAKEYRDNEP